MPEKTKCCLYCLHCRLIQDVRECGKRKLGRLIVDAFYVCPLWAPEGRCK